MANSTLLFPPRDSTQAAPPSVAEILGVLRHHAALIIISTIVVSALALGLHYLQAPVHASTARVLVQADQIGTPSFLSGIAAYRESQVAEPVSRKIETEMALILNRSNALEVVDALDIQPGQLPASPFDAARSIVTDALREWTGSTGGRSPASRAKRADDFLANLSVEPVRSKTAETTSNVLELKFDSTDPALAPRALEAMLAAYLRVSSEQNRRLGTTTSTLLQSQLEMAQRELTHAEDELVALAIRESESADLTASATIASASNGAAGTRRGSGRGSNETANSQLVVQLLELQGQLDELRQTFTDEAEGVRKLKRRVAEMRERLAAQVRATAANTAGFNRAERQRALALDHYVELRRKLEQIDLYMKLTPTALDGRLVVEPPSQPEAAQARRKKTIVLAGPLAGLLLGLLLAALLEALLPRIRTRDELERQLQLPLLGALPHFAAGKSGPPRPDGAPSS